MSTRGTNQTILVSGASGFLGSELVRQLLNERGFKVIAMSSRKEVLHTKFGNNSNLKVVSPDNWINEINQKIQIDVLVNCAFPRTSEAEQLAKGLIFTESLIKDSINLGIKKVINISSQSVYSQKAKSTANENSPVIPDSFYGMTKFSSERIVATICENLNENVVYSNVRLASLSGIELEVRMTNRFVKRALTGEQLTINGGKQNLSYLHVKDAASAILAMINTDSNYWRPVYNLGNYDYCTMLELAEMIRDIAKEHSIEEVNFEVREGQDNFNNLINSELFYNDFNWKPDYTILLMVKESFEHYTKQI